MKRARFPVRAVLLAAAAVVVAAPGGAGAQAAQATAEANVEARGGSAADDTWGMGAHPVVGYGPESSLVLGVGAAIYHDSRPGDPEQRPDEYTLHVTYSFEQQGSVSLDATKYLDGNDDFLDASLEFTNSPNSFFGLGPNTPASAEEEYTQRGTALTLAYATAVLPGLYVGPQYDFFYSDIVDAEGPLLGTGSLPGSGRVHESGIGILATYDTTNAKLYKLHGTRVRLGSTVYGAALGSSHGFGRTGLDVRRYFSLGGRFVLALQGVFQTSYGDVPFFYLPTLGGNKLLRGYSSERHIARHSLGTQAEFRYPLFWRLGGVAFVGAGEVEDHLAEFGTTVRAAGGGGLRVALNRKQTINLRFDITYNTDGEASKYIKLREAF